MIAPRLILCSGASLGGKSRLRTGAKAIHLDSLAPDSEVRIKLEDVSKTFLQHMQPRIVDLLEIAAYVYTADCGVSRGTAWESDEATECWGRDLRFVIPVRDKQFWSNQTTTRLLTETLSFLSNDKYTFAFQSLRHDRPCDPYLEFGKQDWPFSGVNRVQMFSGGLDSLAGALQSAEQGERLVLVSHRPVTTMDKRQRDLVAELQNRYPNQIIHVPVWVNKEKSLGRESTQRTRSFLYTALGTAVAASIDAKGLRFFENGIVSLNFPVAQEALRARASRTTHPKALEMLQKLSSAVLGREFVIDNPFALKTKTEVVRVIGDCKAARLIGMSVSCAHTWMKTKSQEHCGTCSQCIDRRFAVLAAGQAPADPENDYVQDVFLGIRKDGYEKNIAVGYLRHALSLYNRTEGQIASDFGMELSRAIPSAGATAKAQEIIELHKRHALSVMNVLASEIMHHSLQIASGELEESCLLRLAIGNKHVAPNWRDYADRIQGILATGLPTACATHSPKDEPHLQQICDGILKGHNLDLVREYPLLRWSAVKTKPDWSAEFLNLWVELKYVRKKADLNPITEAIAADITKYGDQQRHVLYVIYDPGRIVLDRPEFVKPIHARDTMKAVFVPT